jgi:hypothetical protein
MLSFSLAKPGDWQQLQARHEVIGFYSTIMKPIRIVKRKQSEDRNETTESAKPDEPSTSKIVNTVKSWIAESQERPARRTTSR